MSRSRNPVQHQIFGTCCNDLKKAMGTDFTSLFRVEDNGVLYLSVGYVQTPKGPGWFDSAVIFCPFCGKRLQTAEEIRRQSSVS